MAFHDSYSNLLSQLPPSLIKAGWIRLTTRKRNPLSESEASSISPIIVAFLKHEVDRYQRKKKYRYDPTHHIQSENTSVSLEIPIQNSEIPIQPNIQLINSEDEINTRVKEATDAMHQKFVETTQETLKSIKQQSDTRCEQVKLDMANRSKDLFKSTLKKYIREGTIYNLIHELEEKDGKSYSDMTMKN
jgi:hypothetical protein